MNLVLATAALGLGGMGLQQQAAGSLRPSGPIAAIPTPTPGTPGPSLPPVPTDGGPPPGHDKSNDDTDRPCGKGQGKGHSDGGFILVLPLLGGTVTSLRTMRSRIVTRRRLRGSARPR